MLNIENCKTRQQRLLREMEPRGIGLAVITNLRNIYYFTGALLDASRPQVFALASSGRSLLITNREPPPAAADRVELYTWYTLDRVITPVTMTAEATAALRTFIEAAGGRVAVELESMNAGLASALSGREPKNITPVIQEMIRVKDPDELECIRATIAMTEAGYAAIKARLEPGLTELQAYKIVYEAMADHAGTSVDLKGDFACGTRAIKEGGAPTDRKVQAGDLFIFDLFPAYNGYLCDLCRTFAASPATQLQHDAWVHIMEAHRIAERILRPGAFARDVYRELRAHLDGFEAAKGSFWHHAGHGVGLNEWEFPWLTPGSDHVIREGEVVACEPGLYSEELQGGIRLEHNYLVGANGAVALDQFPMGL